MMAGIGPSDTKPELIIRTGLHALGLRFRLGKSYRVDSKTLPGKPDLVFQGRRAVIMVHGCFWHGHACHLFRWPSSNEAFWHAKIGGNMARDRKVRDQLLALDWRVLEVWECALKGRERLPSTDVLERCAAFVAGDEQFASIGVDKTVIVPAA